MKRLNEALSESVGSESGEVALQRGEAEHALLSCEESLGKKFDSRLGGEDRSATACIWPDRG